MLEGVERLPEKQKNYFLHLHDNLTEILFHAVNNGNWALVIDCAKHHMDLCRCLKYEIEIRPDGTPWECFGVIMRQIGQFCADKGYS